jgi:hypothetical protein
VVGSQPKIHCRVAESGHHREGIHKEAAGATCSPSQLLMSMETTLFGTFGSTYCVVSIDLTARQKIYGDSRRGDRRIDLTTYEKDAPDLIDYMFLCNTYLSIYLSIDRSIHPSIHPSIYPSIYLPVALPSCLYIAHIFKIL